MIPALAVSLAACGGNQKQEVRDGLAEMAESSTLVDYETGISAAWLSDSQSEELYDCVVDSSYDSLSEETIESLSKGEQPEEGTDTTGAEKMDAAMHDCLSQVTPTSDQAKAGLAKAMEEYIDESVADQLGQEALDNYYNCIIDESYDGLSDDTLRSLADGKEPTASMDSEDYQTFNSATETCTQSLMEEAMSGLEGEE